MGCFDTVAFKNPPRILKRLSRILNGTGYDFDFRFQTKSLGTGMDYFEIDEDGMFSSTTVDCSKFSGTFHAYEFISEEIWIDVLITINNGRFVNLKITNISIPSHCYRFIKLHDVYDEDLRNIHKLKRK